MRRDQFLQSPEPEITFLSHMLETISERRGKSGGSRADPGVTVFHPLLLGYNGAGNTGSDLRVIEIIRQCRAIFGEDHFRPGALFVGDTVTHPILKDVERLTLNVTDYIPDVLERELDRYDGVIACEGSMFTSTFSDVMAAILIGGVLFAAASRKPAIAYGVEAGKMNDCLLPLVKECTSDVQILCRNDASTSGLRQLGVAASTFADAAWTFEPAGGQGPTVLRQLGWDGAAPVTVICPINPFWWPVKMDVSKFFAMQATGSFKDIHYRGVFFHNDDERAGEKYQTYLCALADAAAEARRHGHFVVLIGMERLDRRTCEKLSELLDEPAPKIVSGDQDTDTLVDVLRSASLVVSSRFHATVLAMAGRVPTIGVSMDGRIANLFKENDLGRWVARCDAPGLGDWLRAGIRDLGRDAEREKSLYGRLLASQIRAIGEMGKILVDRVGSFYPNIRSRSRSNDWQEYLPPISDELRRDIAAWS
jgi:polysaccharide pyruvyl transferase WcaK-like protein